jgi:hypothetical protein
MANQPSSRILSDWYERVQGPELAQGDIFERCPIFRPLRDLAWPLAPETEVIDIDIGEQDVVVLSQSCDLVPDQKADMWLVILCPLWSLEQAGQENQFLNSSFGKEQCRRGHLPGYHMIAGCEHPDWARPVSIVSFREINSLPLDFMRQMATDRGEHLRMRPPYREHLAQAFARYFMRVGLPTELPAFKSEKAEEEVMRKLRALDDESRDRVLSSFN